MANGALVGGSVRRVVAIAALLLLVGTGRVGAQTVDRDDVLFIVPQWSAFTSASSESVAQEVAELRKRLGPDGRYVRLGFAVYVFVTMPDPKIDTSERAAVHTALASTIDQIDRIITKARAHDIPVALSILTAIRERTDPVQEAAEAEDVRNVQWYADNELASGWTTHSRYARKQRAILEAYVRELGRILASRVRQYPDTLVAASGDGEVELAFARNSTIYADYSPFAIAEFRDWLRNGGLYARAAAFAGQGHEGAARYAGDRTPGQDTNRDGHTLNGDYGTGFRSWNLLHFDWSLDDRPASDPHAIPRSQYSAAGIDKIADGVAGGFDAPRQPKPIGQDAWWDLWVLFKQTMLQRHNQDFARWITSSPDPETGALVPPERWYSYQIPADYMFNGSPQNPNARFFSSASSWWTADVTPYGSAGITAFNLEYPTFVAYTLTNLAPRLAERNLRWGIFEWHPGVLPEGGSSTNAALFEAEMKLIEEYRPSLLVPYAWGDDMYRIQNGPFETALRGLVARLRDSPRPTGPTMSVDRGRLAFGAIREGATFNATTNPQTVKVTFAGPMTGTWTASADQPWIRITSGSGKGAGQFTIAVATSPGLPATGPATATITIRSEEALNSPQTTQVNLELFSGTETKPPFGSFDAPADGATLQGSIAISGWALDDIGVDRVEIWRDLVPGETTEPRRDPGPGNGKVFLATAAFVEGARPDVAKVHARPFNYRAGWGHVLPTDGLWNGGNGTYTLYAVAYDKEGRSSILGRKTITVSNTKAPVP
jgi:hypothetical protein